MTFIGLTSHFLLDLNALIPWFYPFKEYRFYSNKLSVVEWLKGYLTFSQIGIEVIVLALAGLAALISVLLYRRYKRRKKELNKDTHQDDSTNS